LDNKSEDLYVNSLHNNEVDEYIKNHPEYSLRKDKERKEIMTKFNLHMMQKEKEIDEFMMKASKEKEIREFMMSEKKEKKQKRQTKIK